MIGNNAENGIGQTVVDGDVERVRVVLKWVRMSLPERASMRSIDTVDDGKVFAREMGEALSCFSGIIPIQMGTSVEAELQSILRDLSRSRNDFGQRTKKRWFC